MYSLQLTENFSIIVFRNTEKLISSMDWNLRGGVQVHIHTCCYMPSCSVKAAKSSAASQRYCRGANLDSNNVTNEVINCVIVGRR